MEDLQKNINWENFSLKNINEFIPPINYGKVIKVHTGDTITIATKIYFLNDTFETAKIYKFTIYLKEITAPPLFIHNSINNIGKISKDTLSNLIFSQVVEVKNIISDKQERLYADIYFNNIHINEWMIINKFAVKYKWEKKRRMSESDSDFKYLQKNILPKVFSSKENSISTSLKKNSSLLPKISCFEEERPRSNSSQSSLITDCFLSHNWGESNENHLRVEKISNALQKRGLTTWFDENKIINGNIRFKMAEGIDNTKCVVVFITKEYRDKVNGIDMKDNCKYEFTYAMDQLGSQKMIPVVMDLEMKNSHNWKGELGAALGNVLYIDFSEEKKLSNNELEKKYDELCKRIKKNIYPKKKYN